MNENLQLLIVAMIVLACAWRALGRYAPRTAWRLQAGLSYALERRGRPAWLRWLGLRLRPVAVSEGAGCGSGCNRCGGCAAPGDNGLRFPFAMR